MAVPSSAGWPAHSGVLIPEVWSGKTLVKFYESTVLSEIANTDYEGEIKTVGDVVHIRTTPNITVRKYSKGQDLVYQSPVPNIVDLSIDHALSWSFVVDDIDRHQSDYAYVEDWTRDASEQIKILMEGGSSAAGITGILPDIYADADASNKGTTAGKIYANINLGTTGSPVSLTKTNILDYIVDCGRVLDEQNIPEADRWMVLPAWACAMVKKSDLKDASLAGDEESIVRNGKLGMIDRFVIYHSNLLGQTVDGANTVTNIIFGQKSALSFAAQLTKSEGPIRSERTFGEIYRGLAVYGYSVLKPEALGHLYAIPA